MINKSKIIFFIFVIFSWKINSSEPILYLPGYVWCPSISLLDERTYHNPYGVPTELRSQNKCKKNPNSFLTPKQINGWKKRMLNEYNITLQVDPDHHFITEKDIVDELKRFSHFCERSCKQKYKSKKS